MQNCTYDNILLLVLQIFINNKTKKFDATKSTKLGRNWRS